MEKLTICKHCGSDAAIETQLDEQNKAWLCYTCGFSTSTYHVSGSVLINKADENCPQLYKDLKFTDDTNLVWYPSTLNSPDKGMVFLDGTHIDSYQWSAVLATDVTKEEQHKFPIPGQKGKFYNKKMDMTTLKSFNKNEFMDALEYTNMLVG
jgi:hypothetical protein